MTEYETIRERVALALRAQFEAGKLHGWTPEDSRRTEGVAGQNSDPPIWRLEDVCARKLRSLREAFIVLEQSPHAAYGWHTYEMNHTLRGQHYEGKPKATDREVLDVEARGKAGTALARDVLLVARQRKWYRPVRGEEPTTAELRRAS